MLFGKYINRYYVKNAPALLLGVIALIVVDYMQLLIPELYRLVINGVNGTAPFTMDILLDQVCLPMIGIIVAMVFGRFLWRVCFFGTAIKVETDLRNRMFDHSKDLSQNYYQVNKVGNLMSLYTNDLDTINECFGDGVMMFCDALFLGVLAFVKMWRMDHMLTMLSMIPMLIIFVVGNVVGTMLTKKWEARQQAFSDLSDFSQENFSGLAVVKAFVKEFKELLFFRKLNKQNEDANVTYTRVSVLLDILVTLFVQAVVCVILGFGGWLVWKGAFDAGQLVEYIGYFTAIVWPIMAVAMLIEMHSRGKASLNRITELLDAPVQVVDRPGAQALPEVRGKLELRHLTFRYPDGEYDVLRDASFTIEPGERVGVVGRTGAGKTTLVDLILRAYNVPDGTIFLDDQDVNQLTIHSVREGCAYVPQDNFLFSDTIAHNIAFAFDETDEDLVEKTARLSDIFDDVTGFKDGFQTVLGERGVTVSGGQKQRISIARALMKNAPILILDDSVSAVDTRTERVILDNLARTRAGRTTIVIAHRISTVEGLDKIIFLEDGEVKAVGSHDELYSTNEVYRRMVDLQRLEDEAGGEDHE